MKKLFFVGDSITAGAWDEKGGWANRLISHIMQKTIESGFREDSFCCLPYNLGVSGDTIPDILLRLESEVTNRLDLENSEEDVTLVFSTGVNDSIYMIAEDRPRFTDMEFTRNLEELIDLSQKFAQTIMFTGLSPVNDDLLNPIPWAPQKAYACNHVERFEKLIESVCVRHGLPFLPLFGKWRAMPDWKDYLIDGVHPNTKGHALLADKIGRFIGCPPSAR